MAKPLCVCISDLHFNLNTISVASNALTQSIAKAEALSVPLVICGDLNDTKGIIRAEVANTIISILKLAKIPVFILVGNHDKINEKGEEHGLNYLKPYATVIDAPGPAQEVGPNTYFLPYQDSPDKVREALSHFKAGSIVLMHQGVMGAHMGEYVVDKTSIDKEALAPFTCISGHYHRHQTVGTLTYIGSPYTVSFAEANDGPKGFLVVNSDGTFERVFTGLRAHRVIECSVDSWQSIDLGGFRQNDILWLKVSGPYLELEKLRKTDIGAALFGHANFKLDKICTDGPADKHEVEKLTDTQVMDLVIDGTSDSPEEKAALKKLYRDILG